MEKTRIIREKFKQRYYEAENYECTQYAWQFFGSIRAIIEAILGEEEREKKNTNGDIAAEPWRHVVSRVKIGEQWNGEEMDGFGCISGKCPKTIV